jgi:hypothetical protein
LITRDVREGRGVAPMGAGVYSMGVCGCKPSLLFCEPHLQKNKQFIPSFLLAFAMPAVSVSAAVMAIGDTIWEYGVWKDRTKNAAVPFHKDATEAQTSLNSKELTAVRALADRVHSVTGYKERLAEYAKSNHNDQGGKVAWAKWFNKNQPGWKIQKDVEEVLDLHLRHPRQSVSNGGLRLVSRWGDEWCVRREELMIHWQGDKIPTMRQAQLLVLYEPIAVKLFGPDAYKELRGPSTMIKTDLYLFVGTLMTYLWNQIRKATRNQFLRLEKGKVQATAEFDSM